MAAAISVWVISIIILLLAARKCDKRTNMQDDFEAMKEDIAMLKALNTLTLSKFRKALMKTFKSLFTQR